MIDGLGFEELGQAGSQQASFHITGSGVSDSHFSGLNMYAHSSGTFARINNTNGLVPSHSTGSPAVYGMVVQAGTVMTNAGSIGVIEFGRPFASISWYGALTGGSDVTDKAAYINGNKNVSGCDIVGGAELGYDYIAVGPIAS